MAVRPQDDEVLEMSAIELDRTVDEIAEPGDALGHVEADRLRNARLLFRRSLRGRQAAAGAIVAPRAARGFRRLALRFERVRTAVAVVGAAAVDQPLRGRAIAIEPLRLEVGTDRAANHRAL